MTATAMLGQSCILTVLGMGVVFAFLAIMISVMKLLSLICAGEKDAEHQN